MRALRCLWRGANSPEGGSAMTKILCIVMFAVSLIGGATVVLAQSSRDLTEPTGTEANRLKTQFGGYYGYYGGGYRSYAYSPGLNRRWHWSHRHR
jgi:hypothetical protein